MCIRSSFGLIVFNFLAIRFLCGRFFLGPIDGSLGICLDSFIFDDRQLRSSSLFKKQVFFGNEFIFDMVRIVFGVGVAVL